MIHPSIYYSLIYYQRIKLVTLLTFALLILLGFVIVLALVNYLWSTYVTDVIIVGSGPFACHFQALLEEVGITSQLILPPRQYQLGCNVINATPWSRLTKDEIIFPEPSQEELESLAGQYGLSISLIMESWKKLAEEAKKYPQHDLFLNYAENLGTQAREIYSCQLKPCQAHRARVISISQDSKLATIKIGDRGTNLHARLACLVEVSQEDLFEQYLDLNRPSGARVIQSYTSDVEKEEKFGSFFECNEVAFRYHRNGTSGLTLLSSNVNAKFQPETSSYYLDLPETSLHETLELSEFPPCSFRVSHLFFPWQCRDKSPLILDTTNIMSTSPERDLLIVIRVLSKMIKTELSQLQYDQDENALQ